MVGGLLKNDLDSWWEMEVVLDFGKMFGSWDDLLES